ncbi:COP9 signalosome complex subunit 1-like protein [Drosera capensis]
MDNDDDTSIIPMLDEDTTPNHNHNRLHTSPDQFDIEGYASLYTGRTKIVRLMFIADRCEATRAEALRMAYEEIMKGEDTVLYREIVGKIGGGEGREGREWVEGVERKVEVRKEKLEIELNAYRFCKSSGENLRGGQSGGGGFGEEYSMTNLIKESIRMGYNDFGEFYYAHGLLGDAFKSFIRARDYCTTAKHIIHMCLNAILVSIEMGQFTHVANYVAKAETTSEALEPVTAAKLKCAAGLANLETKKYKLAARKFLDVGPELGNNYSENKVIGNVNFRNFLELVPEMRELVNDFYSSRYASCLGYLEKLKANLLLDIHLYDHVETLYNDIRHKALIQYTIPFVSVELHMMANAFKTDVAGLEKELEALITNDQIQARIDSHNKILYARHADQRNTTFQRVLQTGGEFDRDVRAMLLRANILKHEYNHRQLRKP